MPIDILAFAYAVPVAGGGILGYVKSNSIPSLAAGLFFGSVLGYKAYQTSQDPTNVAVFLGISIIVLGGLIGYLFYNSGQIMPDGVSAVMIVRTVTRYFSQLIRTLLGFGPNENMVLIRGNQAVDTGFIPSIISAYSNLHPLVMILVFFFILSYLCTETGTSWLFHEIKRNADHIQASNTSKKWEVAIAYLLVKAMEVILKYEKQIVVIGFAWLPYLAKPSTTSTYLSVYLLHSLIIFLFQDWHYFSFILLANAYFIFLSLRNPVHQFWIIVIAIVFFFI